MSVQTEMFLYYQLGWPGCGSRSQMCLRNKCWRLVQSNPYMKPRIRLSSVVKRNAIHLLAERVKVLSTQESVGTWISSCYWHSGRNLWLDRSHSPDIIVLKITFVCGLKMLLVGKVVKTVLLDSVGDIFKVSTVVEMSDFQLLLSSLLCVWFLPSR